MLGWWLTPDSTRHSAGKPRKQKKTAKSPSVEDDVDEVNFEEALEAEAARTAPFTHALLFRLPVELFTEASRVLANSDGNMLRTTLTLVTVRADLQLSGHARPCSLRKGLAGPACSSAFAGLQTTLVSLPNALRHAFTSCDVRHRARDST